MYLFEKTREEAVAMNHDEAAYLLSMLADRLEGLLYATGITLNPRLAHLLLVLGTKGILTADAAAHDLGISPEDVGARAENLAAEGYAVIDTSNDMASLSLTPKGQHSYEELAEGLDSGIAELLSPLDHHEQESLRELVFRCLYRT
jgi:DNA-binding MarR family transcriptional regulator